MAYTLNQMFGGVVGLEIKPMEGWSPFPSSDLSNIGDAKEELVASLSANI